MYDAAENSQNVLSDKGILTELRNLDRQSSFQVQWIIGNHPDDFVEKSLMLFIALLSSEVKQDLKDQGCSSNIAIKCTMLHSNTSTQISKKK